MRQLLVRLRLELGYFARSRRDRVLAHLRRFVELLGTAQTNRGLYARPSVRGRRMPDVTFGERA